MSSHKTHPLWPLLDQIQMDIRQLAARTVELRARVAALNIAPPPLLVCDRCKTQARSTNELQEHVHRHHAGPLPDAWARADELASPDEPGPP